MAAGLTLPGKFVRTSCPNTSLPRPGCNRLSTRQRDIFATARNTLPPSRPLQEIPFPATSRIEHQLADKKIAARGHELAVAETASLGARDFHDARAMIRCIIKGFGKLLRVMPLLSIFRTVSSSVAETVVTVEAEQLVIS